MSPYGRALSTLGLALVLGAVPLAQEEGATELNPDELLASAKSAISEKKYGKALQDLGLLVGHIGKLRLGDLKSALPPAPSGWTAEDATGEATLVMVFGGGLQVRREYRKGEQVNVTLELAADSPMVAAMAPLLVNPAFLQGQEGQSIVKVKGRNALLEFAKGETRGKLTLLLNNNTALLTLTGNGIQKSDLTDTFGKGLDIEKIEKVLQN